MGCVVRAGSRGRALAHSDFRVLERAYGSGHGATGVARVRVRAHIYRGRDHIYRAGSYIYSMRIYTYTRARVHMHMHKK